MAFKDKVLKVCAPNIDTFKRFPLSVACSVIFYGLFLYDTGLENSILASALVSGFFLFGIARIVAETHSLRLARELILGLTGVIAFTLILDRALGDDMVHVVALIFILGVSAAPFLFRKSDNFSFWFYNRRLWVDVILAIFAALILTGGIAAALASIEYLFGVDIKGNAYEYIWAFGFMVYAPFMALSAVPRDYDVPEQDCTNSKWIFFLLNWVLAPLAIFYFLILYAYGIKILIEWELPKNMIAGLVTGFGALGVVTFLVGWPLRDQSNALVKFLYRHFFALLLPPVVMMFVAVFLRIHAYGITPERYLLIGVAIWLALLGIFYTLRRAAPLKYIFASLLVICIVTVAGPIGAERVSVASQIKELKEVLARNNMLENGIAAPLTSEKITFADERQISSIVSFLNRPDREDKAAHILPALTQKSAEGADMYEVDILKSLNLQYVSGYPAPDEENDGVRDYRQIDFVARVEPSRFNVSGYDELYTYVHLAQAKKQDEGEDVHQQPAMILRATDERGQEIETGRLALNGNIATYTGADGATLDIAVVMPDGQKPLATPSKPLEFTASNRSLGLKLVVTGGAWRDYGNGDIRLNHLAGYLLIRR